jgi:MFS family permease
MDPRSTPLGPRFARLWTATATANLADGVILVGFPLLAVGLTRSPWQVGLVTTLATAPWLLVALPAGAIADRRDRRRLILAAMALRVTVLAALTAIARTGDITLTVLYVAVALLGVAEVVADTTMQSLLPMLVGRDRLGAANGRVIAAQTVANDFLGGPLAGVLVGVGAAAVMGAPALGYLGAALLLVGLRGGFTPPPRPDARLLRDIREGVSFVTRHRVLRALALLAGLLNLAGAAYLAVFVLWAVGETSEIGLRPEGYGLLMGALAVGGIGGALAAERLTSRVGEPALLIVAAGSLSVSFLLPVWSPRPSVAALAFSVIGLAVSITKVVVVSLAQRLTADVLLGRVNATYRLLGLGTMPLGALLGGALGSIAGLPPVFLTTAGLCALAAILSARQITASSIAAAEPAR